MGQLEDTLDLIKWGIDWIIKSIVVSDKKIVQVYVQVDEKSSHNLWNKPEDIGRGWPRPSFFLNRKKPGTDLCSEYVAALAAAHLCFKRAKQIELFDDDDYVKKLKSLAIQLWTFSGSDYRMFYY